MLIGQVVSQSMLQQGASSGASIPAEHLGCKMPKSDTCCSYSCYSGGRIAMDTVQANHLPLTALQTPHPGHRNLFETS